MELMRLLMIFANKGTRRVVVDAPESYNNLATFHKWALRGILSEHESELRRRLHCPYTRKMDIRICL